MNDISIPIVVRILDKEYRVACQRGEEEALRNSARYLDQKMREIRTRGKVIGSDRIAVMAALNIAHELLEQKGHENTGSQAISRRLQTMQEKIDFVLNQGN